MVSRLRPSLRRAAVAGAVLVGAMGAGGCASVPTDGRVVEVGRVGSDEVPLGDDRIPVIRLPRGPRDGDTPEQVVQGFIQAQARVASGHAIARSFLAPDTRWDSGGDALLFDRRTIGAHELSGNRAVVPVKVRRIATVTTATGEYRATVPSTVTLRFVLAAINREWRVVEAPTGMLISASDVLQAFRRATVYFPDLGRRRLVPQQVLLPNDSDVPAVTQVLRALLAGPVEWLAPAVRSAIPPGTELIGPAEVDDGVLTLNLSREAARASAETLPLLAAQIVWSLTEPGTGVTGVRLLIEGDSPDLAGRRMRRPLVRADWLAFTPEPLAGDDRVLFLRDGRLFGLESGGDALPMRSGDGPFTAYGVSRSGQQFAGVSRTPSGGYRLDIGRLTDGPLRDSDIRAEKLTDPTWRPDGDEVWVVAQNGESVRVLAVPAEGGEPTPVRVTGLAAPVDAFQLSPDGARAVLVIGSGPSRSVWHARIQPQPDGVVAVGGLRRLAPAATDVSSVAWESAGRLVFAGAVGGRHGVYQVDFDGYGLTRLSSGLAGTAAAVTGGRGTPGAAVIAEVDGTLWRRERSGFWRELVEGERPAYPG